MRSVATVVRRLRSPKHVPEIPAPPYSCTLVSPNNSEGVGMAQGSGDEGWQIFDGLASNGYLLCGKGLTVNETDVVKILRGFPYPRTVLVQDKREWDTSVASFPDKSHEFTNVGLLGGRHDVFKVTILKDSHQRPAYHREAALEMGCHAWVVYYHPKIVKHLAPYVRERHLIRTYHSIDPNLVPAYTPEGRSGCLVSGALSHAYPVRRNWFDLANRGELPDVTTVRHPGYGDKKCHTPEFLKILSNFKVAFCCSSVFGYSLRKIIEATACGCRVITDLPVDDPLPMIDGNLYRLKPEQTCAKRISSLLRHLYDTYDPDRQEEYALIAKAFYNYKEVTSRLAQDIENLRTNYR